MIRYKPWRKDKELAAVKGVGIKKEHPFYWSVLSLSFLQILMKEKKEGSHSLGSTSYPCFVSDLGEFGRSWAMTASRKSIKYFELSIPFSFFLIFIFFSPPIHAQFTGCWTGSVVQVENGVEAEYPYEICLNQKKGNIEGISYIRVGEVYAEMAMTAHIHSKNYLRFQETKILDSEKYPGSEWCLKKAHLLLKKENDRLILEGVWQAKVSFGDCTPGTMRLVRRIPQA